MINGTLYGTTLKAGRLGFGIIFSLKPDGSNYHVLHSFGPLPDAEYPAGAVTAAHGVLYGTTESGGATRDGAVFSLTP